MARRLHAGTGSLGFNRYYVLIAGSKDDNPDHYRILDIKYQLKPTAYTYLGKSFQHQFDTNFEHHAQYYVAGYQALTRRTDEHLGWMYLDCDDAGFQTGYYSVRERSPFKEAFPCEVLTTRATFSALAELWAEILAAAHARSNKDLPNAIWGLVDDREAEFRAQVRQIAFEYADQVMADWQVFVSSLDLSPDETPVSDYPPPSYRSLLPR